jgi:hypothetical protein
MSDIDSVPVNTRKVVRKRTEYQRERYRQSVSLQLRGAVRYYQQKRDKGLDYIPKPLSKLAIYCALHGLDPVKVVEGSQHLE